MFGGLVGPAAMAGGASCCWVRGQQLPAARSCCSNIYDNEFTLCWQSAVRLVLLRMITDMM